MNIRMGILIALLVGKSAIAGFDHGNGGGALICHSMEGERSVELLDFYEGRVMPPYRHASFQGSTTEDKITFALNRLARLDPERASRYLLRAKSFFTPSETYWISGVDLDRILDSGYIPVPSNCEVRQVAIQREPVNPAEKFYTIDKDIWNAMNEDHRAGLVLHEIVYREMIALGQKDSVNARKFTALISAFEFNDLNQNDYDTFAKELFASPSTITFRSNGFEFLLYGGCSFLLDSNTLLVRPARHPLSWQTLEALPSWLKLDPKTGKMDGIPPEGEGYTLDLNLIANDGLDNAVVPLTLIISPTPHPPPVWVVNPIRLSASAIANQFYHFDLKPFAAQAFGSGLVYRIVLGPTWLRVTEDGILQGTPPQSSVGENVWAVTVQGGESIATSELHLGVKGQ